VEDSSAAPTEATHEPGELAGARAVLDEVVPFGAEQDERFAAASGLEDVVEAARTLATEPLVAPGPEDLEKEPAEEPTRGDWLAIRNGRWSRRGRRRREDSPPAPEPSESDEAAVLESAEPVERAEPLATPRATTPAAERAEDREPHEGASEALEEGLALRDAGQFAEAIEHLERAEQSPEHFAAAYEALETCRAEVSAAAAEPVREPAGTVDEPVGTVDEPVRAVPEPPVPPSEPPASAPRAEASETAESEPDSETAFREWVKEAPPGVLRRALAELEARSELVKALIVLRHLGELDRTDPELARKQAEYAARLGQDREVMEARLELGLRLERAGRASEARDAYERLLAMDPDLEAARAGLLRIADTQSGIEEESEPIRPIEPMRDSTLTGRSSPTTGPASQGFGSGATDLDADEEKPRPYSGVAGGREAGMDFEQLLNEFRAQLHDRPRKSDTLTRTELGASMKEMGRLDDAIRELQAAVREPHAPPLAYELLGEAFLEKGQARVAVRLLEEALDEGGRGDREMLGVLYQLGVAHERMGQQPDALACYERIFSVDIDYKDVQARIASCSM
ncbi:MAG: tetratricopeptide repeat protein, partial [Gemmatimonadota bacterium]